MSMDTLINEFADRIVLAFRKEKESLKTLYANEAVAVCIDKLIKAKFSNFEGVLIAANLIVKVSKRNWKLTEIGKNKAVLLRQHHIPEANGIENVKLVQSITPTNPSVSSSIAQPALPVMRSALPALSNIYVYNKDNRNRVAIDLENAHFQRIVSLDLIGCVDETYSLALISSDFMHNQVIVLDRLVGGVYVDSIMKKKLIYDPEVLHVALFDCRRCVTLLGQEFFDNLCAQGKHFLDVQLVYEYFRGEYWGDLTSYLKWLSGEAGTYDQLRVVTNKDRDSGLGWVGRPVAADQLDSSTTNVILLQKSIPLLLRKISERTEYEGIDLLKVFFKATKKRIESVFQYANYHENFLLFDKKTSTPISCELKVGYYEQCSTSNRCTTLHLNDDPLKPPFNMYDITTPGFADLQAYCRCEKLLKVFPEKYREALTEGFINEKVFDIALDKGKSPYCLLLDGARYQIFDDGSDVKEEDLMDFCSRVENQFGNDNRVGIEGELHRISCIRNKQREIIGMTIRIGRYFAGNTYFLSDLLFHKDYAEKSILVLGPPGSGKTSLIRGIARKLAEIRNVMIVDTSNEISGDSDVPHCCVGDARRMMVKDLEDQYRVMIECVQNHTPDILIVDEIGRTREVKAAKTCKERGVRLIASAHGDFRKLLKNTDLRGLVGGVENVTLGDMAAKRTNNGRKTSEERAGEPIFDIVIQLEKGRFNICRVIKNVARAVDSVLDETTADCEIRTIRQDKNPFISKGDSKYNPRHDSTQKSCCDLNPVYQLVSITSSVI